MVIIDPIILFSFIICNNVRRSHFSFTLGYNSDRKGRINA